MRIRGNVVLESYKDVIDLIDLYLDSERVMIIIFDLIVVCITYATKKK